MGRGGLEHTGSYGPVQGQPRLPNCSADAYCPGAEATGRAQIGPSDLENEWLGRSRLMPPRPIPRKLRDR